MPLYLLHGFRWPRNQARIFIILSDLGDATADYLQFPNTVDILRTEIFRKYPHLEEKIPGLTFIEQYDPDDLETGTQPWAFVADTVSEAAPILEEQGKKKDVEKEKEEGSAEEESKQGLSLEIVQALGKCAAGGGETAAMNELKDALAAGVGDVAMDANVGWWAVWNGDVERRVEVGEEEEEEEKKGKEEKEEENGPEEDGSREYFDAKANRSDDSIATQVRMATLTL